MVLTRMQARPQTHTHTHIHTHLHTRTCHRCCRRPPLATVVDDRLYIQLLNVSFISSCSHGNACVGKHVTFFIYHFVSPGITNRQPVCRHLYQYLHLRTAATTTATTTSASASASATAAATPAVVPAASVVFRSYFCTINDVIFGK